MRLKQETQAPGFNIQFLLQKQQNQLLLDAARICMTHSFPFKNVNAISGEWDCSQTELGFANDFLSNTEYSVYDKLIQLCDALALPTGFCLIEKRLVDVALRRGINSYTIEKWKAYLQLQQEFDQLIGRSIYEILPGVVSNTFQFNMASR